MKVRFSSKEGFFIYRLLIRSHVSAGHLHTLAVVLHWSCKLFCMFEMGGNLNVSFCVYYGTISVTLSGRVLVDVGGVIFAPSLHSPSFLSLATSSSLLIL